MPPTPTTEPRLPAATALDDGLLLRVEDLQIQIGTEDGLIRPVDGVSFELPAGKTLCIVGESGSGKSLTGRALMNLLPDRVRIAGGRITYRSAAGPLVDIGSLPPRGPAIRAIRGAEISLVSQEPMAALSPVHTVGQQLDVVIRQHMGLNRKQARERALECLNDVGIPRPAERLDSYPFEFSGGMRQRVCIALALACGPRLIIADEPTTALDVTTQANILDLFKKLQAEHGLSILFITHDLGVVADVADQVAVMYLGKVVETGTVDEIFYDPRHPYTQALLKSVPTLSRQRVRRLAAIRGLVPSAFNRPSGCAFHPRCDQAIAGVCDVREPPQVVLGAGRTARCVLQERADPAPSIRSARHG
jgi:peptide/nickel transport system ATP-binding protein